MVATMIRCARINFSKLAILLGVGLLSALGTSSDARAATLYWDANGATAGTGGTGAWNTSDLAWRDGSTVGTLQAWMNNNDVNLPTTAGIVTLQDDITIGQNGATTILSGTGGYTINAVPGKSLTFDATGGTGTYRITTNVGSLTINAPVILKGYRQNPRGTITFNGDISQTGGAIRLEKNLFDTMTLNGNNTFDGVDLVQGGLVVGHNSALGANAFNWSGGTTLTAGGGDRVISNTIPGLNWNLDRTISGSNDFTFTGSYEVLSAYNTSSFASLNITAADGQATFGNFTTLVSGTAGGFKKLGAGTMILNGIFTPGNMDMTVEGGKMLVNTTAGITSGGADYRVTTGTLGGTGTINLGAGSVIDVSSTGSLAPGASVGTLTVNGAVLLNGTLANEFSGSTTDLLAVNGNLTLGATSILDLLGVKTGSSYTIASYTGTLAGTFGTINGLGDYVIDYGTGLNSQITLQAIPAPEPSSIFLLGLGAVGVLRRVRRRRSSVA